MSTAATVKATRCFIHRATTSATVSTLPRRRGIDQTVAIFAPRSSHAPRRAFSAQPAEESDGLSSDEEEDERAGDDLPRVTTVKIKPWSAKEKRTGVLAMKVGMMPIFDSWGVRHGVTVLQLDECDVLQVKKETTDGYTSIQMGIGECKEKNVTKPLMGEFKKVGVKPKRQVMEFRVTPEALIPPGFRMRALHFVPGQKVDACGTSKGKGFQGGMKRWNFAGQRASHGVSKTHRHIGSTGQCQDPGKVFKGKKMPGRMGGERVTVQNLTLLKVDPVRELLYIKGHVPGNNGGYVRITDAVKGADFPEDPPFPTYVVPEGEEAPTSGIWRPQGEEDPLRPEILE